MIVVWLRLISTFQFLQILLIMTLSSQSWKGRFWFMGPLCPRVCVGMDLLEFCTRALWHATWWVTVQTLSGYFQSVAPAHKPRVENGECHADELQWKSRLFCTFKRRWCGKVLGFTKQSSQTWIHTKFTLVSFLHLYFLESKYFTCSELSVFPKLLHLYR